MKAGATKVDGVRTAELKVNFCERDGKMGSKMDRRLIRVTIGLWYQVPFAGLGVTSAGWRDFEELLEFFRAVDTNLTGQVLLICFADMSMPFSRKKIDMKYVTSRFRRPSYLRVLIFSMQQKIRRKVIGAFHRPRIRFLSC